MQIFIFYFLMIVFILISLFLAVLGLHCCTFVFLVASGGTVCLGCVGFSPHWLLLLWLPGSERRLSTCGARA